MGRTGTISLRSRTVIEMRCDVYTSLVLHGFTRIITFNGHRLANLPVIQLASKKSRRIILRCSSPVSILVIALEAHKRVRTAPGRGVHGCEFETSANAAEAT